MTLSGAKKDTCEMIVHIQTSESIESIRTKLQAKITEVQNYYNTFAEQHNFSADDGQYSIAKKNELLQALQNAAALLNDTESSKEDLYNITVDLTELKSDLNTFLNIGAATGSCSYSSAWAYGRTSQMCIRDSPYTF